MTNSKKFSLVIIFLLLIIIFIGQFFSKENSKLTTEIIHLNNGWGYKISLDNKPFIYQENIPAINGNHKFPSKEAAKAASMLVRDKIINNRPPTNSVGELIEIGVLDEDKIPVK